MTESYIVICLDDTSTYTLATRLVFDTYDGAVHYARTLAPTREPHVVSGRWHELRFSAQHEKLHELRRHHEHDNPFVTPRTIHRLAQDLMRDVPDPDELRKAYNREADKRMNAILKTYIDQIDQAKHILHTIGKNLAVTTSSEEDHDDDK